MVFLFAANRLSLIHISCLRHLPVERGGFVLQAGLQVCICLLYTSIVLLLLCLAMVLGMAACGGNATTETKSETKSETTTTAPETSETASETTADPANTTYQDTITVGVANDITTLDPQGSNTDANMMAFTLTHETLVEVDPETNEVIPGMATSWTTSDDGCTFTFEIPENVTFSDGTPCTANDIKFTFERAAESSFTKTKVELVTNIEVVDDTHVAITISKPSQDFLMPVSYTHLDVYKRQILCSASTAIHSKRSFPCVSAAGLFRRFWMEDVAKRSFAFVPVPRYSSQPFTARSTSIRRKSFPPISLELLYSQPSIAVSETASCAYVLWICVAQNRKMRCV